MSAEDLMQPDQPRSPGGDALFGAGRGSVRERVHTILEEGDTESRVGLAVEIGLMVVILSNVLAIILETVPSLYRSFHSYFDAFESVTVYIFAIEYAARVWSSVEDPRIGVAHPVAGRLRFALRPMMIIDFLSFAPFLLLGAVSGGTLALRALRILRLLRLLKIARYSQAVPALIGVLYTERRALIGSFILLVCVMCIAGELMHLVEGSVQPAAFGTLPDCIYWAITTLATVGYGDHVPITIPGRLVAGLTMVSGLVLFAMPIGIIATGFVNTLHRREFGITWSMVKRQPLFAGFTVEAVTQIVDMMGATVVQDHARFIQAGQPADRFFVVVSGRGRAEGDDGVRDLSAGDVIGAEALDDPGRYASTVTARTEMRLMVLSADELRRIARRFPVLEARIREFSAG
jgi:voltage-gated potassium channel